MNSDLALGLLMDGVDVWNARREGSDFSPDLGGGRNPCPPSIHGEFDAAGLLTADGRVPLDSIDLCSADMRDVNFFAARLVEVDLTGADLRGAGLGPNTSLLCFSLSGGAVPINL